MPSNPAPGPFSPPYPTDFGASLVAAANATAALTLLGVMPDGVTVTAVQTGDYEAEINEFVRYSLAAAHTLTAPVDPTAGDSFYVAITVPHESNLLAMDGGADDFLQSDGTIGNPYNLAAPTVTVVKCTFDGVKWIVQ